MKLIKLISEIKKIKGKLKIIKQDSGRPDMVLFLFPDGEREWFFWGGYYYALSKSFSVHSSDEKEIQEYKDLFDKYGYPWSKELSYEREFRFYYDPMYMEFEPNIKKYSDKEQAVIDSGRYRNSDEEIAEVKKVSLSNYNTTKELADYLNKDKTTKNHFIKLAFEALNVSSNNMDDWKYVLDGWLENDIVQLTGDEELEESQDVYIMDDDEDDLIIFSLSKEELMKTNTAEMWGTIGPKIYTINLLGKIIYFYYY